MKKQKIDREDKRVFFSPEKFSDEITGKKTKSKNGFMAIDPENFPDKDGWFS